MNYLIFCLLFIDQILSIRLTSNEKKINLCINCKHFISSDFNENFGKCNKYSIINEISGDKILLPVCIIRNSNFLCGKKGKNFESKYILKDKQDNDNVHEDA